MGPRWLARLRVDGGAYSSSCFVGSSRREATRSAVRASTRARAASRIALMDGSTSGTTASAATGGNASSASVSESVSMSVAECSDASFSSPSSPAWSRPFDCTLTPWLTSRHEVQHTASPRAGDATLPRPVERGWRGCRVQGAQGLPGPGSRVAVTPVRRQRHLRGPTQELKRG